MQPSIVEPLHQLADAWRAATRRSHRRAAIASVALVWVVALIVARHGTSSARIGAAIAMAASAVVAIAWHRFEQSRWRDPRRIVSGLASGIDPERAEKALRALSLVGPDGGARARGTSAELARLHVERAIAQLPSESIVERAVRVAGRVRAAALVVAICVAGVALAKAWSVLEGADVLAARNGSAPASMRWLGDVEVVARPPEYLHDAEQRELTLLPLLLPYGTLVTVRGTPLHAGRSLLLSDGTTEIPFVEDGAGAVVARWPLTGTTNLQVVARFGDVVIREPEALAIESIPDLAPVVTVEGAPQQLLLADQREDVIPIKYTADDDHGLREVQLILRSGVLEDRRVLARLDGETKGTKGGYVLKLRDPFIKKSHAPVEVTVEAKDNDPLTGPKWGASPPITLIPPEVGEPEARRLDALRLLRNALVDTLAWRLDIQPPSDDAGRKSFVADEKRRTQDDERLLSRTFSETYAGVRFPSRVRAMLVGQQEKTHGAVDVETRAPSGATHATVVRATERFVLIADAALRGLGLRDTRDSARQLANVADDLATGASRAATDQSASGAAGNSRDTRSGGTARMDAATRVLAGGGRVMARLGPLGRDIGEIVDADLSRVTRARSAGDLFHAELAARDLAARLHEPDPSFGSRGSVGRAGGESGGGRGTPGEEGEGTADEVERAEAEAEHDLERLAQEHAGEIGKMEQALAGATSEEELEQMRRESKRHADAVREAERELPSVGTGSDSWTSKGAAARELAEQMARSLEEAHDDEAVQSGRAALGVLDEAKKMLQKGADWFDDPTGDGQKRVDDVRRKLEAEEQWAQQQLEQMRRLAAERARKQLEQGGEEEDELAGRAHDLASKASEQGSLPQQVTESIDEAERDAREAARALRRGDADKGLRSQRDAQRDLEAAQQRLREGEDDDSSPRGGEEGNGRSPDDSLVKIPGKGEHKGPEEFRQRVVRGLGQPTSGSLKDAVHRYAEGLLR